MGHWLAHFFGFSNGDGNDAHYLFWSGPGSDITELGIIAALLGMLRKHNCHEPRCWRIGRFPVEGTTFTVCRKHHPNPPGPGEIHRRHHLYLGSKPGRG